MNTHCGRQLHTDHTSTPSVKNKKVKGENYGTCSLHRQTSSKETLYVFSKDQDSTSNTTISSHNCSDYYFPIKMFLLSQCHQTP